MLQNFNILTGVVPVKTGNAERDLEAVLRYLPRVARACETNFDLLDQEQEKLLKKLEDLEEENEKLGKRVEELEQAASNSV